MFVKALLPAIGIAATVITAASAQTPTRIDQFNAWGAYSYDSDNGKVCYILSAPTESEPGNVNHGDNYFLVTQQPGQNVAYEPQAVMGYPLSDSSEVTVTIDGREFTFYSQNNTAWVENAAEEPTLVEAMRGGQSMTVEAVSARGTNTRYAYSLSGVTAGLDSINDCD